MHVASRGLGVAVWTGKPRLAAAGLSIAALGALAFAAPKYVRAAGQLALSDEEAAEIAVEGYLYAYPMVLMEVTRRVLTNTGEGAPAGRTGAPMNQFVHRRDFPDASFTSVVRPNADTLYSSLWFDVSKEPLVITVPDSGGRYYLLPIMDMWTDIFASHGTRTTGGRAMTFAIVGPNWRGALPEGVEEIRSPTPIGWMIGRTQTNGKADYANVHKFQAGLKAAPLGQFGQPYAPPKTKFDAGQDMRPPSQQVGEMDAARFFALFAELWRDNPPHANDYPIVERLKRVGLVRVQPFDVASLPSELRTAALAAPAAARNRIDEYARRGSGGTMVNGWRIKTSAVGTYGTDYLSRALVALNGLAALSVEDATYPQARADGEGRPFESDARYVVHFAPRQLPPVRAFWSLTIYNDRQLFAANPIDRYTLGDRDRLTFNEDGSLDLYIQRAPPSADKESNWLPAPESGGFSLSLRLYWPQPAATDGAWQPPSVARVE